MHRQDAMQHQRWRTNFFWVEILFRVSRHVLRQPHGLVAKGDGVLDDVFELVLGVAGAELPGMGVHCEGHCREACPEVFDWKSPATGEYPTLNPKIWVSRCDIYRRTPKG